MSELRYPKQGREYRDAVASHVRFQRPDDSHGSIAPVQAVAIRNKRADSHDVRGTGVVGDHFGATQFLSEIIEYRRWRAFASFDQRGQAAEVTRGNGNRG